MLRRKIVGVIRVIASSGGRRGCARAEEYSKIGLTQGVALGWIIPRFQREDGRHARVRESCSSCQGSALECTHSRLCRAHILNKRRGRAAKKEHAEAEPLAQGENASPQKSQAAVSSSSRCAAAKARHLVR